MSPEPVSAQEHPLYRFGEFELDPEERRLLAHGSPVTLTPKVFDTLVLLVERAPRAVSKDELMSALWPRGFVDESNLTKHLWMIRKALGDGENGVRCIETVPKLGYRFVAPVQRIERPGFAAIANMAAPESHGGAAAPLLANEPGPHIEARPASRRKPVLLAVAAMLALLIGAAVWSWRLAPIREGATPGAGSAVAIVEFSNLSQNPKDAWLGPALGEMLATEIMVGRRYHVLPDELVRSARADLAVPLAGGYAEQSLETLHRRLDVDYVLSGGYLVTGSAAEPRVHLDLTLQDVRTGAPVASLAREAPVSDVPALVAKAGAGLRERLGIAPVNQGELQQIASAQPPTAEVARRIGFALDAMHRYDPARARDELLDAVAQAPDYGPAYAYLARAWSALGYKAKALAAARQAMDHLASLGEDERVSIEAELYKAEFDWPKAAETLRRLVAMRPLDPEPRLRLVEALLEGGHPDDADPVIAALRGMPEMRDDPRVELAAARAANARGDPKGRAEHGELALHQAQARDNLGLEAQAREELGVARYDLGQYDEAETLHRQNIAYYQHAGNPHGEAFSHEALANVMSDHGQVDRAREEYQRALSLYQQIGDLNGQASSYDNISTALWTAGDGDGAMRAVNNALALVRETGDKNRQAWNLNALASIEDDASASDEAGANFREAIGLAREASRPVVWYLAGYAGYLELRGDLAGARAQCALAREDAKSQSDRQLFAYAESQCAAIELDGGEVDAAIASYKRSQAAAQELNDHYFDALAALSLGQIEIGRGQWAAAIEPLRHAIEQFATTEDAGGEANAQGLIALSYAALEQNAERDKAARRAQELRARINQKQQVFVVDLARLALDGQTGDRAAAVANLRSMAGDSDTRHWVSLAFEARLAALKLLSPDDSAAIALRGDIEREANRLGFKWVLMRLPQTK